MKFSLFLLSLLFISSFCQLEGDYNDQNCTTGCCCPSSSGTVQISGTSLGYIMSFEFSDSQACGTQGLANQTFNAASYDQTNELGEFSDMVNGVYVFATVAGGSSKHISMFGCSSVLVPAQ